MLAEAHGDDARARGFLEEAMRRVVASTGEKNPVRLVEIRPPCGGSCCARGTRGPRWHGAPKVSRCSAASVPRACARGALNSARPGGGGLWPAGRRAARLLAAVAVQRRQFAAEWSGLPEAHRATMGCCPRREWVWTCRGFGRAVGPRRARHRHQPRRGGRASIAPPGLTRRGGAAHGSRRGLLSSAPPGLGFAWRRNFA